MTSDDRRLPRKERQRRNRVEVERVRAIRFRTVKNRSRRGILMRRGIITGMSDRYSRGYRTALSRCTRRYAFRFGPVLFRARARIHPEFLITMNYYTCRVTLLTLERRIRIRKVYRLNKLARARITTVSSSLRSRAFILLPAITTLEKSWLSEKNTAHLPPNVPCNDYV